MTFYPIPDDPDFQPLTGCRPMPAPTPNRPKQIDRLAAIIRDVDGNHDKGAAALAEAILSHPDWRMVADNG